MRTVTLGVPGSSTDRSFFVAPDAMITAMRQKTANYCFVACVASALLDEGYNKLQDLIVDRFPSELGKDSEKPGVPKQWTDVQAVIKGLNLAVSVTRDHQNAPAEARNFLVMNKHRARWIFIETTPQGTHCLRLCEIRDDGVTVMDPVDGNFSQWTWAKFDGEYHALVVLHWGASPLS